MWWLIAIGVWLGLVGMTLALLAAAKRGDQRLEYAVDISAELAAIGDRLGCPVDGVVLALREPGNAGQVVVTQATGEATRLVGRTLPPDDFVASRAVLTGRCEVRGNAAAAPLWRGRHTIGAIAVTVAADRPPLGAREVDRLVEAAAALDGAVAALR